MIRVQPDEAIYMKTLSKAPGINYVLKETPLDMTYKSRFSTARIPDAYERLLHDILMCSQRNFIRDDELDVECMCVCGIHLHD